MAKKVEAGVRGASKSSITRMGQGRAHPRDFWKAVGDYLPCPPLPTVDSVYRRPAPTVDFVSRVRVVAAEPYNPLAGQRFNQQEG